MAANGAAGRRGWGARQARPSSSAVGCVPQKRPNNNGDRIVSSETINLPFLAAGFESGAHGLARATLGPPVAALHAGASPQLAASGRQLAEQLRQLSGDFAEFVASVAGRLHGAEQHVTGVGVLRDDVAAGHQAAGAAADQ